MAKERPDRYVATVAKRARRACIFVDYLRNDRGATAVAAYSTRASVSTHLNWDELSPGLRSDHFTVGNVLHRLSSLKRDPWRGFLKIRQRLPKFQPVTRRQRASSSLILSTVETSARIPCDGARGMARGGTCGGRPHSLHRTNRTRRPTRAAASLRGTGDAEHLPGRVRYGRRRGGSLRRAAAVRGTLRDGRGHRRAGSRATRGATAASLV